MKFMIVDDNAEMRQLIRTIIGEEQGDFLECSNGREAVAVYEAAVEQHERRRDE